MPRTRTRHRLALALALPFVVCLGGSRATLADPAAPAGRLVIVGTADLKGKTSPCGCHIPRGGFARIASVLDSLRASGTPVLFVDAGGSFPEVDGRTDLGAFMLDALALLKADAVGVGPRDLRYGVAFLREMAKRSGAPLTCANLVDRRTRQPLFPASRLVTAGGVRVGVLALIGERMDLGPARDSLDVLEPETTARREVAALKARGARVVVLLAHLGRVGGEDVAAAVPGIDAVVLGHDIPVLPNGRQVGDAIASYAGEQGQQVGVITLTLGGAAVTGRSAEVRSLGPEVREQPAVLARVKSFEDDYNERMRREQRRLQALAAADPDTDPVDHYVGVDVCGRCHQAEVAQWKTTAHSLAWETLVRENKDATPECIPCHAVGYRQPGGFADAARTPHLANVQCENCHGMGTLHEEGWLEKSAVGERTCRGCHNEERDPEFDFKSRFPLVTHDNTSGESIRIVKARRSQGPSSGSR